MRWAAEEEEEGDKEEIGVKGAEHGRGSVNMKASLLAVNMVMMMVSVNENSAVQLGKLKVVVVVLFGGKGGLWRVKRGGR